MGARLKPRTKTVNGRRTAYGYCAVFYDPDKRPTERSVTLRTKDKRVAQRRLNELERKQSLGLWDPWLDKSPEDGIRLREAVKRYLHSRRKRRPKTLRADESTLRLFGNSLSAGMRLDGIHPKHVTGFLDKLYDNGRSAATRSTYLARIRSFSGWCVNEGLVKSDFTRDVEKPKLSKKEKSILTREQYASLVARIEAELVLQQDRLHEGEIRWMLDLLPIAIETGMRLGEICAMRWSWVSLDRKTVTVSLSDGFATKSGHERTIPIRGLSLRVIQRLSEWRANEDDSTFVLTGVSDGTGRSGLDPTYVSKRFKHFVRLAGLPDRISFHSLRHTFCTWLIQDGVPVPVVQRLAGHADIKTTMGYVHVAGADLEHAIQQSFG